MSIDRHIVSYKKKLYRALRDEHMRRALSKTIINFRMNRREVFSKLPHIEKKAEKLRKIRESVLADLWFYLDKTMEMIEKNGGHVYLAKNADQARKIIGKICGGKLVIKSKSLTTEEIGLNKYLEELGCEVWETDLGELIVQLAKSRPMHYVTPSIHIPIEKVVEIFSEIAGRKLSMDVDELVRFARSFLREKFFKADVGITGANIISADTGSIFIVENEGNIRFVSNAPQTHVVISGIEKIVPSVVDGMLYIDVLAKYAGYVAPSYVSVISGPSKTGDIEKIVIKGAHGPKELHVVFLDNGRSKMLEDDIFRQALLCMRCGSCLFECPVYGVVCGYFGEYYFGGIGAIYMSFLEEQSKVVPMIYTCMLCGKCKEVCPMKIDTPSMILELRKRIYVSKFVPKKILDILERTEKNKTPYA